MKTAEEICGFFDKGIDKICIIVYNYTKSILCFCEVEEQVMVLKRDEVIY